MIVLEPQKNTKNTETNKKQPLTFLETKSPRDGHVVNVPFLHVDLFLSLAPSHMASGRAEPDRQGWTKPVVLPRL